MERDEERKREGKFGGESLAATVVEGAGKGSASWLWGAKDQTAPVEGVQEGVQLGKWEAEAARVAERAREIRRLMREEGVSR